MAATLSGLDGTRLFSPGCTRGYSYGSPSGFLLAFTLPWNYPYYQPPWLQSWASTITPLSGLYVEVRQDAYHTILPLHQNNRHQKKLASLNMKSFKSKLSDEEQKELAGLKTTTSNEKVAKEKRLLSNYNKSTNAVFKVVRATLPFEPNPPFLCTYGRFCCLYPG